MLKIKQIALLSLSVLSSKAQTGKLESFTSYNIGQAFTCITVDANNTVWAGTNKTGLFSLSQAQGVSTGPFSVSSASSTMSNYVIQSLAADRLGNVWVGHGGSGGGTAAGGGLEQVDGLSQTLIKHFSADRNAKGFTFLERDGLATFNVKSVTVDPNNTVWTAHRYHDLTSGSTYIVTPGAMSRKTSGADKFLTYGAYEQRDQFPEWAYPAYTYNPPVSATPGSRTCNAIGSNAKEVWISVYGYTAEDLSYLPAHIKRYGTDGQYKDAITFASIGASGGGVFNGIYLSPKGDAWVTLSAGKGFAVLRDGVWNYLNPADSPCILPAGTLINENAIWGNSYGNVFIGTNNGLLVYNGRDSVKSLSCYSFHRSSVNNDMISNNILGGCSEKDSIQWIATDKGIMRIVMGRYKTQTPQAAADKAFRVQATKNEFSYESCDNSTMNAIETMLKNPNIKNDMSYHLYTIKTEVCDQKLPNGKYCTAENIYKMMKDDITLAAITPYDFPQDDLTMPFLSAIKAGDLKDIEKKTNAIQIPAPPYSDLMSPLIKKIADVVENRDLVKLLGENGKMYAVGAFFTDMPDPQSLTQLMDKQRKNPSTLKPCSTLYKLYNSYNFIRSRTVFIKGNTMWAGRKIMNCDVDGKVDPEYDPIYTHANDREYTVTNYTAKGHMLYPGKITRKVTESCGKVTITTVGEGTQFCGNNTAGRANANGNFIVGGILFKNVDFRLIKKFNSFN